MPQTAEERDRIERRKTGVFLLALLGGVLVLFAGFDYAMTQFAHSVQGVFSGFDLLPHDGSRLGTEVQPIPIPQSACAYLRIVSVAANDAAAPWADAFTPSVDPAQFSKQLAPPLASLDAALGAAVDHVPGPVASDFRTVRATVEVGRLNLPVRDSVPKYLDRSGVVAGYGALQHASALVGNACGFVLAPPIPF